MLDRDQRGAAQPQPAAAKQWQYASSSATVARSASRLLDSHPQRLPRRMPSGHLDAALCAVPPASLADRRGRRRGEGKRQLHPGLFDPEPPTPCSKPTRTLQRRLSRPSSPTPGRPPYPSAPYPVDLHTRRPHTRRLHTRRPHTRRPHTRRPHTRRPHTRRPPVAGIDLRNRAESHGGRRIQVQAPALDSSTVGPIADSKIRGKFASCARVFELSRKGYNCAVHCFSFTDEDET